jgi:signal transduction histidine kinase/CheY-like chemotaxis protein
MGRVDTALRALIEQAWATRYRQPQRLHVLGAALTEAAPPHSVAWAWGAFHQALGLRAAGDKAAEAHAAAQAEAAFALHGDAAGQRVCRVLAALPLLPQGQGAQAEALIGDLGDWPAGPAASVLEAHAAQFSLFARAHARSVAGRWDDSLRDRYAALQQARATGDDGAIAHALADLASAQADLFNADDALALATEAEQRGEAAGRTAAWLQAAFNRLAALQALERHEEAAAAAERLLPDVDALHERNRESALLLLARARLHGGDAAQAQQLLDRSVQVREVGMRAEWTLVQAELWLHQGHHQGLQAARDLCEAFLAEPADGRRADSPDDLRQLHRAAAQAHEQLGDTASALRHVRVEQALTAQVNSRAARAQRLALDIQHQLSQERWQREQAQQRQQASEAERARLDEVNSALEAANLAKTRFLAAASHDLRQPVQALALNMAALEQEDVTPAQGQLVQRMGRSLQALGQMFDVLLDISRLDAGIVPVAAQPLDLRPLLLRLHDEVSATAAARGLQLRLHLPRRMAAASAPLLTQTDPVLLERCLRNLLDNALKYTPQGTVLLALRPAQRGSAWGLQVWDTGIGMTPEVQARVFDEFYQAHNPERDRARGLGLGLAIVQRLAQLLGHGLELRSRAGRGTRLQLTLPRAAAASVAAAAQASSIAPAAPCMCLVVMDDDADVREGLVAVLERWGHTVVSGADHLAVLQHWREGGRPMVQAIVSDLRLRGSLTGVQAVAALRQAWSDRRTAALPVPALVITGDVAPERLQLLRDSGLPWLPKPVMPMRLRSWLAAQAGSGFSGAAPADAPAR